MTPLTKRTDACCRLVPNAFLTAEDAARALCEMHERFGFDLFYLTWDYYPDRESVTALHLKQRRAMDALRALLPRSLHLNPLAAVQLTPTLAENRDTERLILPDSRYLPLALPLTAYEDWIDASLNHLLYKRHHFLLFLSFEHCTVLYPPHIIEKLLRIPNAAFQFGYKSLADPAVCRVVSTLLHKGAPILLGSSVGTVRELNAFALDEYLASARYHLKSAEFELLSRQSRAL